MTCTQLASHNVLMDMKIGMAFACLALTLPAFATAPTVEDEPLNVANLKKMVANLGYDLTELNSEVGKEKYSFVVKTEAFNVPLGIEISPSKNYIWLTANLGPATAKTNYQGLLRANGIVQPTFFYVTSKDVLMCGYPIENHGVTPAWMKKCIDKVAKDITDQGPVWNTGN